MISRSILLLFLLSTIFTYAQPCESMMVLKLVNIRGGVYGGQNVKLISKSDSSVFESESDGDGEVTFSVPCDQMFDVLIANHTKKIELLSPSGGTLRQSFSYPPDLKQKEKLMAMSEIEIGQVNQFFENLPDTIFMKTSVMPPPTKQMYYYAWLVVTLRDLKGAPLADEVITITGRRRNKSLKGKTDKAGRMVAYLPKGDFYDLHFKYHKNYQNTDCSFSKGTADLKLTVNYIGTKEVERRRREEKERLEREEKRLKYEKELFTKRCAALGLSEEECHRREMKRFETGEIPFEDTVVHVVLQRNSWKDKLIVCDLTGSMSPYAGQISAWYQLNFKQERKSQFVFFNDGDQLADDKKIIGKTGGIYYSKASSVDSVLALMAKVQANGSGGDVEENNIEAIMKGTAMAKPFSDLVMIADNHAPVKDISLLKLIRTPVHIILCGVQDGMIEPDYLQIAWKTKGTIHTIEEDIHSLARMSEGQQVTILGKTYKIIGGEFFLLE